jgi:hypothetical protein
MTQENQQSFRLVNLDTLRGLFIFLALLEHFTYFVNYLYIDFFKDAIAFNNSPYYIYKFLDGKHMPASGVLVTLYKYLGFWIEHIFLTLAAFNLAKYSQSELNTALKGKLKLFVVLFFIFLAENFMVARHFGEAISIYPIMSWFVILGLLSFIYSKLGSGGVATLLIAGLLLLFNPVGPIWEVSLELEEWAQAFIHPEIEYNAKLEYFIPSACMGFFLGHVHYQKKLWSRYKDFAFLVGGLLLSLFFFKYGNFPKVNPRDIFEYEYVLAKSGVGMTGILGIQMFVISLVLYLEKIKINPTIPLINWIGKYSLLVFLFHRVFFVHLYVPLRIFIGAHISYPLTNTFTEQFIGISFCVGLTYLVKNGRIFKKFLES